MVGARKACQRANAGSRTDHDYWLAAPSGLKFRVVTDKSLNGVANGQIQELARAKPAGMAADTNLDKAVVASRSQRIEPWHVRPFGNDAQQVT